MRRAWVLCLLLACSSPQHALIDAAVDAKPCTTCMPAACSMIGYVTGEAPCGADCKRDDSACDACMADPAVLECRSFVAPSDSIFLSEVTTTPDGPRVAVALARKSLAIYGPGTAGLEQLHQVELPEPLDTLVAVPGGWLLFPSLRTLAPDGTLGEPALHPVTPKFTGAAYGPAGHVLFAWNVMLFDSTNHPYAELDAMVVDAAGAIVTPKFMLLPSSVNVFDPIVTTDGTSFFVGTLDQVIRLDAAGTVLGTTTGFPGHAPAPVAVTYFAGFANGTGWYVALGEQRTYWLQRFDASGARVGAATQVVLPATPVLNYFSGFSVDGDHLVALAWTDQAPMGSMTQIANVMAVQISATGVVSTPTALGVGVPQYLGQVQRFGSELLAGWLAGDHVQLARVPP